MSVKLIIDGTSVNDVLDQMDEFPGGEPQVPANAGFHIAGRGSREPDDASPDGWDFYLGEPVEIIATGQEGFVEARRESVYEPDFYLVNFNKPAGEVEKVWFTSGDLNYASIH
jgi:hypothetical protein